MYTVIEIRTRKAWSVLYATGRVATGNGLLSSIKHGILMKCIRLLQGNNYMLFIMY